MKTKLEFLKSKGFKFRINPRGFPLSYWENDKLILTQALVEETPEEELIMTVDNGMK